MNLSQTPWGVAMQNKTHTLNNEIVVNALAGVIGVGITYIKDDEDILPILKVRTRLLCTQCASSSK